MIFVFNYIAFYRRYGFLAVGYLISKINFYESLISIVSLLENKNEKSTICIYAMIGLSLPEENIKVLLSLQEKYSQFKINVININEDIDNYSDEEKLILFFKFFKYFQHSRILYLNSDTLIFKDLSSLSKVNIKNDYFIGPNSLSFKYVLLINLQKIRKENCTQKCLKMQRDISLSEKGRKMKKKFAANRIFKKFDISWKYNSKIYNQEELFSTYQFPNIYYFNETQPYLNNFNSIYKNTWHIYANKTGKYNDIIQHFNLSFNINEITELNIAISFDDGYTYPTIITLASLFETSSELTKFNVYCSVPNNYPETNKKKILSLLNIYPNKGKIHFIRVPDLFPGKVFQFPKSNYYKLYYDKLLPKNIEKIIYLEADMIYLEDIRLFNDLDINNKSYLGLGTPSYIGTSEFIIAPHIINLKLIRNTNLTDLYTKFINENLDKYKFSYIDERSINLFNQGRLGRIPIRYSAPGWFINNDYYYQNAEYKVNITKEEYELSKNDQAFVHFTICKPWRDKNKNCKFGKKWWFLAEKTGFINEIMNMNPGKKSD